MLICSRVKLLYFVYSKGSSRGFMMFQWVPQHSHTEFQNAFSLLICPPSPCFLNHVLSAIIVQEVNSRYLMLSKASLRIHGLDSVFWCSLLNGVLEIPFQGRHGAKYGQMTRGFCCPYFPLDPRLPEISNPFTRSTRAQQMLAFGSLLSWACTRILIPGYRS